MLETILYLARDLSTLSNNDHGEPWGDLSEGGARRLPPVSRSVGVALPVEGAVQVFSSAR